MRVVTDILSSRTQRIRSFKLYFLRDAGDGWRWVSAIIMLSYTKHKALNTIKQVVITMSWSEISLELNLVGLGFPFVHSSLSLTSIFSILLSKLFRSQSSHAIDCMYHALKLLPDRFVHHPLAVHTRFTLKFR
jgi:hypothetical protein